MTITRLQSHPSSDGAGVRIRRIHGFRENELDPFLMLDEIHSDNPNDYIGGFPSHPHRGMETLTYIRHGGFIHEDHMGNRGEIHSGEAQWMSAGRGVIHSEMPLQKNGLLHGFQLWINLPARDKMKPAQWQDYPAESLPWYEVTPGSQLKVIAGQYTVESKTFEGPIKSLPAQASVADLHLQPDVQITQDNLHNTTLLLYVYEGSLEINGERFNRRSMARIQETDSLSIATTEGAGVLLLKGQPINEPMVHHGPFVMNTEGQIRQAIRDYQRGVLTEG